MRIHRSIYKGNQKQEQRTEHFKNLLEKGRPAFVQDKVRNKLENTNK